jgi:hypothetical protein
MEERSQSFKEVRISNAFLRSSELSLMENGLFIEIHLLAAKRVCLAFNNHLKNSSAYIHEPFQHACHPSKPKGLLVSPSGTRTSTPSVSGARSD